MYEDNVLVMLSNRFRNTSGREVGDGEGMRVGGEYWIDWVGRKMNTDGVGATEGNLVGYADGIAVGGGLYFVGEGIGILVGDGRGEARMVIFWRAVTCPVSPSPVKFQTTIWYCPGPGTWRSVLAKQL